MFAPPSGALPALPMLPLLLPIRLIQAVEIVPNSRPTTVSATGKLRLMVEANPLAFVVQEAGGYASDGYGPILDIEPSELHQRDIVSRNLV